MSSEHIHCHPVLSTTLPILHTAHTGFQHIKFNKPEEGKLEMSCAMLTKVSSRHCALHMLDCLKLAE